MDKIALNIRKYREAKGFSQEKMSKELGISTKTLYRYETGDSEPTFNIIKKIANILNISPFDILDINLDDYNKTKKSDKNSKKSYKISKLSLQASAGSGIQNYNIEETNIIHLPVEFFKTPQKEENLKIIEVIGDSMEPTIKDGSYVIIDTSKKELIDGGIYAINLDNQILIKRLQKIPNGIKIISDNKNYSDIIYNPQETNINFHIIGKKIMQITP